MNIPKIPQRINRNYYNNINTTSIYNKSNNIAFCAAPFVKQESKFFKAVKDALKPVKKLYNKGIDRIAGGLSRLLETNTVFGIIKSTEHKKLLMNHLMTFGSIILSGFYVMRTLENKDLDEKKKKTLAINQSLVFALSTITCYTVERWISSKVNTFANRLEAVNMKHFANPEDLLKLKKGVKPGSKIAVFDTIFRFLAPVFLTPLANHIGNKLNEKKEAVKMSGGQEGKRVS